MIEVTASLRDYPGYVIYNTGKVYSEKTNKFLKPTKSKWGYSIVHLSLNNKGRSKYIHRLVGECFIGPRPSDLDTDHIDRNKDNNNVTNLRYISKTRNNLNRNTLKNNQSGDVGVFFHKQTESWRAAIKVRSKSVHLGNFLTKEEALFARGVAEKVVNILCEE